MVKLIYYSLITALAVATSAILFLLIVGNCACLSAAEVRL